MMQLVSMRIRKIYTYMTVLTCCGIWFVPSAQVMLGADNDASISEQAVEKSVEAKKPQAVPGKSVPVLLPKKKDHLSMMRDDAWLKDPFKNIQTDVKSVIKDFDQGQTRQPVKTTQPRIISRLDTLITMLEKSCKSGSGAAGQNPTRPANSSTLAKGPGGQGKLKAPDKKGRNWADLTPKQREKILQSRTEGFPPGYEDILADYFRRLARNQAVDKNKTTPDKQK
ncbi:MAG: hypothetical protein K0U86_10670 [Planctomycetes bacterium]|nr:hypothetical protein [Planctomycetota bacterium]MCH9725354.1 hypothetical protein [Planctomycetota bacterium]MCH9776138.1 hypothetical protein [Planctomycetota bacterium]